MRPSQISANKWPRRQASGNTELARRLIDAGGVESGFISSALSGFRAAIISKDSTLSAAW
jgi:hypothetical protein